MSQSLTDAAAMFAEPLRIRSPQQSVSPGLEQSYSPSAFADRFMPGDLLFFRGEDATSRAIAWKTATWSQWLFGRTFSHVGICAEFPAVTNGIVSREPRVLLVESTTMCGLPCLFAGQPISGVQAHPPQARVDSYPGKVWRLRLTVPLDEAERRKLSEFLAGEIGKPYDAARAALLAGRWVWRWEQLEPTPDARFCSELAAVALKRVDRISRDHDPESLSPNRLARLLLHSGEAWSIGERSQSRRLK